MGLVWGLASVFHHRSAEDPVDLLGSGYCSAAHGTARVPAGLPAPPPPRHAQLMETEPDCGRQEQNGSSSSRVLFVAE